jgi:hypothetical protein
MRSSLENTQQIEIQRGLRIGIAMLGYGHKNQKEILDRIGSLFASPNVELRKAGVLMRAMAFVGSNDPDGFPQLLQVW